MVPNPSGSHLVATRSERIADRRAGRLAILLTRRHRTCRKIAVRPDFAAAALGVLLVDVHSSRLSNGQCLVATFL